MRNGLVGWVAAFAVSMAATASAQDRLSLDGAVNVPPALQDEGKHANFTVGIRSEAKRHEMDFDDSSVTGGGNVEQGVDFLTHHNATFLTAKVEFLLGPLGLSAHAGVGLESLVSTVDADAGSFIGADAEFDDQFEDNLVYELGGGARIFFEEAGIDAGIRGTYRAGESDTDGLTGADELDYEYISIEGELEVGYRATGFLRIFGGGSYTLYDGEWSAQDPATLAELEYDVELDQPFGIFVGADLFVTSVTARFQAEFLDVDTVAFLVFLGLVF